MDQTYFSKFGIRKDFIKGVASLCGIYDLHLFASGGKGWGSTVMGTFCRNVYLYPAFGQDEKIWKEASPLSHVHKESPPFFIVNASFDLRLEQHTEIFAEALQREGVKVKTDIIPGTRHGSIIGMNLFPGGPHSLLVEKVIEFIQNVLDTSAS